MPVVKCDVLVVGCGPAGASAALAASKFKKKTICIDKKERIGFPVKCAEGIAKELLPLLPFKIPKKIREWELNGIRFWVDGISIERTGGIWEGYSIDREKFDIYIADLAKKAGAEMLMQCEAKKIVFEDGKAQGAVVHMQNGDEEFIKAKSVVAADGSESLAARELKLEGKREYAQVISFEMKNANLKYPKMEQIFFGEFSKGGYAYIFPKGKNVANVGVGCSERENAEKWFAEFMEVKEVKQQLKDAEIVCDKSKREVWSSPEEKWAYGNLFLAGDAANHNLKPFIEGILPGVASGYLAGEAAAISSEGKNGAEHYTKEFEKRLGGYHSLSKTIESACRRFFSSYGKKERILFAGMTSGIFALERMEELEEMELDVLEEHFLSEIRKQ